jgi:NAD(P)-dependent dehydrogenase (short-subunit alcohol dehydrogenase family)
MPTAVITGANRGLGLEFTRRYLADSWEVIALTRNHSEGLTALEHDPALSLLRGDLTDATDLERLSGEIGDASIDLLINNAGIMGTDAPRVEGRKKQELHDFLREEWRAVFEINLFTPAQLIALLRSRLVPGARVVTISSSMGSITENEFGGWFAYRASKAAVNSLMKSVALELGNAAIAIALHPGWVRTDMGGPDADIGPDTSVSGMMDVIHNLEPKDSGAFLGYDGKRLPY